MITFPLLTSKALYQPEIIIRTTNNLNNKFIFLLHQIIYSQPSSNTNCKNCFTSRKSVKKNIKTTSRRNMSNLMKLLKIISKLLKNTKKSSISTLSKKTKRSKPNLLNTNQAKCSMDKRQLSALSINKNCKCTTLQILQANKTILLTTIK